MRAVTLAALVLACASPARANTEPPWIEVTCHCPLGHETWEEFHAEHDDDPFGDLPPMAWWPRPQHEGPQE